MRKTVYWQDYHPLRNLVNVMYKLNLNKIYVNSLCSSYIDRILQT